MSWTEADIIKLERAIASGALTVRYGDMTVTYQSLDAMRAALAQIRSEVRDASAGSARRSRVLVTRKGV